MQINYIDQKLCFDINMDKCVIRDILLRYQYRIAKDMNLIFGGIVTAIEVIL